MNFEHFIAQKIAFSKDKSFTKVILGITIAAIALSISIMIISTALIAGFKHEINAKIFGFWGHVHITDANINRNFELRPINFRDPYVDTIQNIKKVNFQEPITLFGKEIEGKYKSSATHGGIRHVQPFIILPGLIETKSNFQAILFKGIEERFNWEEMARFMVEGRGITTEPIDGSSEIVISKIIANKLDLKVGQKIIVSFVKEHNKLKRALSIVGIYNTGLEEYDKRFVIGDMRKLSELLEWAPDECSGIEIFLDDIRDSEVLTEYIYNDVLPMNLYAETIQSKFPNIFEWLKLQDINEKIILQLMTLVAILNMVTVLLILILERSHMIGILKSLGATNGSIRKIFMYHAAYLVMFGLLLGNIIGLSLCYLQQKTSFIKLDEASYYLSEAPILFHWPTILMINVFAFIIIVSFLYIPTLLISKITPVKVLRFE